MSVGQMVFDQKARKPSKFSVFFQSDWIKLVKKIEFQEEN
jgi:hypothetical protein